MKLTKGMLVAVMHGWDEEDEYSFKAEVVEYARDEVKVINEEDVVYTLNEEQIQVIH